jgi:hypothetical protein
MRSARKNNALRFDLRRFVWLSAVLTLPFQLAAQPPLPTLILRWDYPDTNNAAGFLLLRGTNVCAGTGKTNRTAMAGPTPPGIHTFSAAATNASGAATSTPVQVRVVRVTLEKAPTPAGPWTSDEAIYKTWQSGPSNQFLRARLDLR